MRKPCSSRLNTRKDLLTSAVFVEVNWGWSQQLRSTEIDWHQSTHKSEPIGVDVLQVDGLYYWSIKQQWDISYILLTTGKVVIKAKHISNSYWNKMVQKVLNSYSEAQVGQLNKNKRVDPDIRLTGPKRRWTWVNPSENSAITSINLKACEQNNEYLPQYHNFQHLRPYMHKFTC